jgi:phospholipid/cholesterol/gamma-HCH transport system substrate-binding protein
VIRLPRAVWTQLAILAVITVVAVGVMAFGFINVPALIGIGRYHVTVDLPATGGLYPTSVVTYRGTEIGRVASVNVTATGAKAELKLNSDNPIPADVTAAVHSRSAVGEQFLELTPKSDDGGRTLADGDTIAVADVTVPADIGSLLDATNTALQAIPQDNLKTVVDEAAKAVAGLGPELARIVDGSTSLAIQAGENQNSITQLIDQSPPVLDSQVQSADSIATWAQRMASITGQLSDQDAAFGDLLRQGAPALNEGKALLDRVAPALPVLLANMVSLGDIAVTYRPNIEQLLVLFPQGTAVMSAIALPNADTKQDYRGIYLDFNLNLNLPPPCNTGFLPVQQQRSPVYQDQPDRTLGELYCRLPQDSPYNVRGVRNIPCAGNPAKRAPSVELCESKDDYVPLNDGTNWKGDPNATLTGQSVPQFPPGMTPPPADARAPDAIPGAAPPAPANPPLAFVPYDPASGVFTGPDGRQYTQADLAHPAPKSWESLLIPPGR